MQQQIKWRHGNLSHVLAFVVSRKEFVRASKVHWGINVSLFAEVLGFIVCRLLIVCIASCP
jgi:hypothetical protein